MSLQQGPTDLLITSVAHASRALSALKVQCQQQAQHHRQVIGAFLAHLKLEDIRQIPKRYSEKQLNLSLVEAANCYNLTVNSSFMIIAHGIGSLEQYFTQSNHIRVNQHLSLSSRTLMLMAKTKLQLEKNLTDFIRDHRKPSFEDALELPSLPLMQDKALEQEAKDKTALEQTIQTFEEDVKTLSEPERLIIEYYETILKADATFKKLAEFEKALSSLQAELDKLTPINEAPAAPSKNWESSFGNTDVLDCNDLTTLLQQRLSINDTDPADWDSLSLPGSKRSSLQQAADPLAMNTALLIQFQQQAASSAAAHEEEVVEEETLVLPIRKAQPGESPHPDL